MLEADKGSSFTSRGRSLGHPIGHSARSSGGGLFCISGGGGGEDDDDTGQYFKLGCGVGSQSVCEKQGITFNLQSVAKKIFFSLSVLATSWRMSYQLCSVVPRGHGL